MAKRSGVAVTGGALLALLCPGVAAAQDGDAFPREVSSGYASWNTASVGLGDHGISLDVAEPAVRGSADRAWFPTTVGGTDPRTGGLDAELGGSALLVSATGTPPLPLSGLRLRLDGGAGALYARTAVDGQARQLALADVKPGAEPVVRTGGVTWTGLRASLTEEGAVLLSEWSGTEFTAGDAYGVLDVTVGTSTETAETAPDGTPRPTPGPSKEKPAATPEQTAPPSASVTRATLPPGTEQQVTGAGFEPGEVVLVAIDDDTRYQTVADGAGRVARTFPVYDSAVEGAHTVQLYTVTGGRSADAEFSVRTNSLS